MSVKYLCTISMIITCRLSISAQADTALTPSAKYKTLYFYTYGLQAYGPDNQCITDLKKKFGFDKITKAGCIVRPGQLRRWQRHNERIEKKMEKRHGADWREKYKAELAKC